MDLKPINLSYSALPKAKWSRRKRRLIVAAMVLLLLAPFLGDIFKTRIEIDSMTGSIRVRSGMLWFNGPWTIRPSAFSTEMQKRGEPVSPHWRFSSESTHGLIGARYCGAESPWYQFKGIPMQSMTAQEKDQILKAAAVGDDATLQSVLRTIADRYFDSR